MQFDRVIVRIVLVRRTRQNTTVSVCRFGRTFPLDRCGGDGCWDKTRHEFLGSCATFTTVVFNPTPSVEQVMKGTVFEKSTRQDGSNAKTEAQILTKRLLYSGDCKELHDIWEYS
jgi:hypothetical protein